MTTTLSLQDAPATVAEVDVSGWSAAALARELLAEHDRLGVWVADLDLEEEALWAAMRPWLARLSRDGRDAAREIAGIRGRAPARGAGRPLTEADAVVPVVWTREIGTMQQLLGGAVVGIEGDGDPDARCALVLLRALKITRAVTAALATVAAASRVGLKEAARGAGRLALRDTAAQPAARKRPWH